MPIGEGNLRLPGVPRLPSLVYKSPLGMWRFRFFILLSWCFFGVEAVLAQTVSISPPSATVPVSGTQQFTAATPGLTVTCITFPCYQVRWSVNGITGGNSAIGTIDADGLYTA